MDKKEKDIVNNPHCKKYKYNFLDSLKITRHYLIGSVLYTFINRLNPLTWLFFLISFLFIPIYCLFENTNIKEQCGYLFKMIFKGEL